jgi:hypothetical protein
VNTENRSKINQLIQQWPRGTASTTSALFSMGFSNELVHLYKNSHWIQPLERGAYALAGDRVEWSGGVYALQNQLGLTVHPGGKTALALRGFSHYVTDNTRRVFLYGLRGEKLPAWFQQHDWGVEVHYSATTVLPATCQEGFSEYREKEFSIRISFPERAALEMLYHLPGKGSFEEAYLIMESLITLRPAVVQSLLECCTSVKVKRLFMYMAERHQHPWVGKLDLSKVDFGQGKRVIVKAGILDKKYNITVPRQMAEESV